MPDLNFQVLRAEAPTYAAAPLLNLKLHVENRPLDQPIHSVALRCQVQIAATRRRYGPHDQARLTELFGEPERWSQTLRSLLWAHTSAVLPPFVGSAEVDLPLPCTYDFNIAATKYFYALEEGDVPLLLLFSGTIFYAAADGALQVAQIPWSKEAQFRLPVQAWKTMIDHYYPNNAWLPVPKALFDRLYQYKVQQGFATWEQALERLLPALEEQVRS